MIQEENEVIAGAGVAFLRASVLHSMNGHCMLMALSACPFLPILFFVSQQSQLSKPAMDGGLPIIGVLRRCWVTDVSESFAWDINSALLWAK